MNPKLSIIFVYFNTPKEILDSIISLKKAAGTVSYEVIIVDNASSIRLPKKIISRKDIKIVRNNKNLGYSKGVNMGEKISNGQYLLVVNPDTIFKEKSIELMLKRIDKNKRIGVIGPQQVGSKGEKLGSFAGKPFLPQAIFVFSIINKLWSNNPFSKKYYLKNLDIEKEHFVDTVGGACMMIRRNLFKRIGGFDDQFFMYFEEADFCVRIKDANYKVLYYPEAKIIHLVGRSNQNKEWIKKTFEKSRFLFFKKYHGLIPAIIGESIIRVLRPNVFLLLLILILSLFMNLYRLNDLTLFIGDFGRDYLAARDMILTRTIPLVGIPSSVVWLHQGPLSIYFIGVSFLLGGFNPIVPAITYGLLGTIAVYFVYKAGSIFFNKKIGLLSALFFATSPLIIINVRGPYHTSAIPLFSALFFIILFKVLSGRRNLLPYMFFVFGILFLLELSNAVIFVVLAILWMKFRKRLRVSDYFKSLAGLLFGLSPFLLHDLTQNFIQIGGFVLWTVNRVRLFLGTVLYGDYSSFGESNSIYRIYQQFASAIFPSAISISIIVAILVVLSLYAKRSLILRKKKDLGLSLLLLWIVIPLIGFVIHSSPGPAYFPILFPAISILIGFSIYTIGNKLKIVIAFFVIFTLFNAYFTIQNEYFLITKKSRHVLPPESYSLGYALPLQMELVREIVKDADGRQFGIEGGGFLSELVTGIDNYSYLLWYEGGLVVDKSSLTYIIYEDKKLIPAKSKIFYQNKYLSVIKREI